MRVGDFTSCRIYVVLISVLRKCSKLCFCFYFLAESNFPLPRRAAQQRQLCLLSFCFKLFFLCRCLLTLLTTFWFCDILGARFSTPTIDLSRSWASRSPFRTKQHMRLCCCGLVHFGKNKNILFLQKKCFVLASTPIATTSLSVTTKSTH